MTTKATTIARLQKDILSLQGFKQSCRQDTVKVELGAINNAFPNGCFPTGAVHEFICNGEEQAAATGSFITGILSYLVGNHGIALWITDAQNVFPPALKAFGVEPGRIIFIQLQKAKELLWATEEALKCTGLVAVIAHLPELSFTASRRLQLAVEHSQVTGFVVRQDPKTIPVTACVTRWQITSLPVNPIRNLPGIGFPHWNIELQKVRNGKPGSWQIEFAAGKFRQPARLNIVHAEPKKKTG